MTKTTSAVEAFIGSFVTAPLRQHDLSAALASIADSKTFKQLLLALIDTPAFSETLGTEFVEAGAIEGLAACRRLRSCLNLAVGDCFGLLAQLIAAFDVAVGAEWLAFATQLQQSELRDRKLLVVLLQGQQREFYTTLAAELVDRNPHAVYPTSSYRESEGHVVSTQDDQVIEAVVGTRTFTSIRVVDHCLDPEQPLLRDTYIALGRCVCVVDQNVDRYYSEEIEQYFAYHGIPLEKLVYRAMEVDKGIQTVERLLGDFKRLGVSRNEPVLIVGGGVLADTAGLACALYHRNTPYVMLSTSIVAGIDAGPSPRTCCDGFGYKNLFGAYHPPALSITDRHFFKTLHEGWLRHGIIEIVKMAVVKDAELFEYLEQAGPALITTRFGTVDCEASDAINALSQRILGAALRSYVAAEYGNMYETHQCRPHAYGHTWSPGFEIAAGLLHGHAVSIGMGFGAYLSYRLGWITTQESQRILNLISSFGLSLWHDILLEKGLLWEAQEKIVQKRGGNLAAPLPKGAIGQCAYLNELSQADLYEAIAEYQLICEGYPRKGEGIDPLCSDVGLEDPSTVAPARSVAAAAAEVLPQTGNGSPVLSAV